jgi:UDP-GlcNAc:undecaprenyl-phosphate GlcNAc-1-phosphate transferase
MDLPTICGTTWVNRALLCVFGLWLVNSVNFLDVMDGLAGGVMLMIAAASAVVLQRSGDGGASALATGVVGAIAGFLLFNWHPARIFMGDVGSFSLGYLLFTLVLAADREAGHATAFALAAVPMLEVASSSMLRIAKSTSPLRGDGTHVALMLLDRGIRVPFIVLAFLAVTVSCACAAVMLAGPD